MAPSSTAASQPMYAKDEKTLCFHGELLYEAKVLEVRRTDSKDKTSPHEYRVHYKGWKNSWDDWVPQDRLRKLTDDNRELAANLKRELTQPPPPRSAAKAATSKNRKGQGSDLGSGRGSEERHSSVPAGGRGTKRGKDNDIEKVGSIVPPNPDCYTNFPLDTTSNGRSYSLRSTEDQDLLQGGEAISEGPPYGLLRPTTQLFPISAVSTCQTLPSHQEKAFLPDSGRGLDSPLSPTAHGRSGAFLNLQVSKTSASAASMTLRGAGLKAQRQIMQKGSRAKRKAQKALQHLSDESSEGESETPVCSPNRSSKRYATIISSSRPGSRDLTPALANANKLVDGKKCSKLTGLEIVRDFSPPPDELEYISKDSEFNRQHVFFAPLLGGTTCDEKHKIEDELVREGKRTNEASFRHPKYDQTLREDPHNENKIEFYYDQNPPQRLAIAGVAKNPIQIDPPGSATPFDALKFPERLVSHLNRMDADTVVGWNDKSLKKIPTNIMSQLKPEVLACIPESVFLRIPHLREKCCIDTLEDLEPKSNRLEDNFTKFAILKLQDRKLKGEGKLTHPKSFPMTPLASCLECTSIGIKCSRDLPQCLACKKFGEECVYDNAEGFKQSLSDPSTQESTYLGLDLTCPITQKHLKIAQTSHLDPRMTRSRVPSDLRPKPTFSIQPNVPKVPMYHRTTKRIALTGVWQALEDLNPHEVDFRGPALSTLTKFYPGASVETLTYPYSYTQEETFHLRPSIRITIPDHLKTLLVDDWENVTKSLLLVPLPSKAPANFIIDSYYDEEKTARRLGSADLDVLEEFCAGMKVYFEKSVGKILLYRFERGQLAEVRHLWESGKYPEWEGKGPGDAYGAEHLCRMLVNLPELIAQTNMDNQSVNRLREEISKFCTWLARNSGRFFCAKYEKPSADYIENAR